MPQLVGQFLSMWMSTHFGVQMPQLVGQFLSMWSALLLHSPSFAHCGHDSSRSAQMCEHTPHVCGQIVFMCSALSPVHSPSTPHAAHERSLSLQKPTVAEAAAASVARTALRIIGARSFAVALHA